MPPIPRKKDKPLLENPAVAAPVVATVTTVEQAPPPAPTPTPAPARKKMTVALGTIPVGHEFTCPPGGDQLGGKVDHIDETAVRVTSYPSLKSLYLSAASMVYVGWTPPASQVVVTAPAAGGTTDANGSTAPRRARIAVDVKEKAALTALAQAGPKGMTRPELKAATGIPKGWSGVLGAVNNKLEETKGLIGKGFVAYTPPTADRLGAYSITDSGKEALAKMG